jgi:hypothetical protein
MIITLLLLQMWKMNKYATDEGTFAPVSLDTQFSMRGDINIVIPIGGFMSFGLTCTLTVSTYHD